MVQMLMQNSPEPKTPGPLERGPGRPSRDKAAEARRQHRLQPPVLTYSDLRPTAPFPTHHCLLPYRSPEGLPVNSSS